VVPKPLATFVSSTASSGGRQSYSTSFRILPLAPPERPAGVHIAPSSILSVLNDGTRQVQVGPGNITWYRVVGTLLSGDRQHRVSGRSVFNDIYCPRDDEDSGTFGITKKFRSVFVRRAIARPTVPCSVEFNSFCDAKRCSGSCSRQNRFSHFNERERTTVVGTIQRRTTNRIHPTTNTKHRRSDYVGE
jgi:hypothetical protein